MPAEASSDNEDEGEPMTSAAPGATRAAPERAGPPQAAPSHRDRHAHAGHDRRAGADLGRLQRLHPGSDRREPLPDAPQSLESQRPDVVDRHHGDWHGARHRHAPHRPVSRIDHRLRLDHRRRRASTHPADLSRPRQSGDLDHCGRHSFGDRRGDRRLSRLARRLSRHSCFHRHPWGPIVLARRRVVGDDGPDHRTARRPLCPDGRRPARFYRRDGELGPLRAGLRRHRLRHLRPATAAGAVPLSRNGRCGPNI